MAGPDGFEPPISFLPSFRCICRQASSFSFLGVLVDLESPRCRGPKQLARVLVEGEGSVQRPGLGSPTGVGEGDDDLVFVDGRSLRPTSVALHEPQFLDEIPLPNDAAVAAVETVEQTADALDVDIARLGVAVESPQEHATCLDLRRLPAKSHGLVHHLLGYDHRYIVDYLVAPIADGCDVYE